MCLRVGRMGWGWRWGILCWGNGRRCFGIGCGRGGWWGLRGALGSAILRAGLLWLNRASYPRPTNGIFVAITVMNNTLASSGRLAM